jgi:hypothetical protein
VIYRRLKPFAMERLAGVVVLIDGNQVEFVRVAIVL